MTVISSLFSGISGLVANGSALSVAGDNIANMSTPAFKSSVPVFESALSQRIGEAEVGLGARLAGTSANFTQGAFANTTRATDLAIQGRGFFVVQNNGGERFYTRAGMFEQDSSGQIVTSAGGYLLQGYSIDDTTGQVSGALGAVSFESVSSAPQETSEMSFNVNLDADATAIAGAFDGTSFANAASSSNFSYSQTVYDSLGVPRSVTTYFKKDPAVANQWSYHTLTDGSNLSNYSGAAGGTVIIGQGTLTFNTNGTLASHTPDMSGDEAATGTATDIAAGQYITPRNTGATGGIRWVGASPVYGTDADADGAYDAGDLLPIHHEFGQSSGSAYRATQYSSTDSAIKTAVQNGRAQGELQSIEFLEDGTLRGNFSNGDARDLYKIPIASFANDNGLNRVGSNLYSESGTSGQAQIGLPGTAGRGQLRSFATEQSNVDLASEFVRIITFQRAFQASSRTVSTAAELLQDLVNLGR